jgi:hypothetical protein
MASLGVSWVSLGARGLSALSCLSEVGKLAKMTSGVPWYLSGHGPLLIFLIIPSTKHKKTPKNESLKMTMESMQEALYFSYANWISSTCVKNHGVGMVETEQLVDSVTGRASSLHREYQKCDDTCSSQLECRYDYQLPFDDSR